MTDSDRSWLSCDFFEMQYNRFVSESFDKNKVAFKPDLTLFVALLHIFIAVSKSHQAVSIRSIANLRQADRSKNEILKLFIFRMRQ